jgi:hypothetical protein
MKIHVHVIYVPPKVMTLRLQRSEERMDISKAVFALSYLNTEISAALAM